MTDNDTALPVPLDTGESRRSFLKKSAVVTTGASIAASGVASAQDNGGGAVEAGPWQALIFQNNFHPEARFSFVSDVIEWTPNYGGIDDSWFTDYNTRMIRWHNTGEHVQLFVAGDADVGEYDPDLGFVVDDDDADQPQVYEVSPDWSIFEDYQKLASIDFSPVDEETEDQLLESDDWWEDQTDGSATNGNGGGGNTTNSS